MSKVSAGAGSTQLNQSRADNTIHDIGDDGTNAWL